MSMRRRATGALGALALLLAWSTPAAAATSYPNDYFYVTDGYQWALAGTAASINAPAAWCVGTGAGVLVADVDTGANFAHEDLAGKLQPGAAFLGGTKYPDAESTPTGTGQAAVTDDNFHGTMTTGIMVARTNNGRGMAAVAPDATALIVKVLDSKGEGYESDVANGIRWAADHGAKVINVSIGPNSIIAPGTVAATVTRSGIVDAVEYAYSQGAAVALAAGNEHISASDYLFLAQSNDALTVGALGPDDRLASYSNYAYGVSIYAPGGDAPQDQASPRNWIVSTSTQQGSYVYEIAQGTSFSTPQVAGALALLMGHGMTAAQAMAAVTGSAATSADGRKQLDVAAALGRAKTALCGAPSTAGTVVPNGFGGSAGRATPKPTPTRAPQTAASRTPPPTAVPSATPPDSAQAGGGQPFSTGGGDAGGAGHRGDLPPADTKPGGGSALPAVLVLGALVLLVIFGAPVGRRLARVLRPPR